MPGSKAGAIKSQAQRVAVVGRPEPSTRPHRQEMYEARSRCYRKLVQCVTIENKKECVRDLCLNEGNRRSLPPVKGRGVRPALPATLTGRRAGLVTASTRGSLEHEVLGV
jgi:hypothetical protein